MMIRSAGSEWIGSGSSTASRAIVLSTGTKWKSDSRSHFSTHSPAGIRSSSRPLRSSMKTSQTLIDEIPTGSRPLRMESSARFGRDAGSSMYPIQI